MGELRLVGLHDDGEHVVLEGSDGQRFRLPIDEALRAAVRRDRPVLEQLRAGSSGSLSAKEIQSRIRAGASAEDVASDSGMPLEMVRRYEGPVLAEREFVAGQARVTRIGHDTGAPLLGELVTDRLATRGVEATSIRWEAYRQGAGTWTVEVLFEVGDAPRSARWTYDQQARTVRAVDDEARWLSETELNDSPIPRRHLASVRAPFDDEVDAALRPLLASVDRGREGTGPLDRVEVPAGDETVLAEPAPEPEADPHALLDQLSDRRGVRQPVEHEDDDAQDDDEVFEGFGPQHAFDFDRPDLTVPGAHPPHSRPDLATDATVLEMPTGSRRGQRAEAAGATTDAPATDAPGGADDIDRPDAAGGAAASESASAPEDPAATDAQTDAADSPATGASGSDPKRPARPRARKGRASVPSWDEIVFGAKPE